MSGCIRGVGVPQSARVIVSKVQIFEHLIARGGIGVPHLDLALCPLLWSSVSVVVDVRLSHVDLPSFFHHHSEHW